MLPVCSAAGFSFGKIGATTTPVAAKVSLEWYRNVFLFLLCAGRRVSVRLNHRLWIVRRQQCQREFMTCQFNRCVCSPIGKKNGVFGGNYLCVRVRVSCLVSLSAWLGHYYLPVTSGSEASPL